MTKYNGWTNYETWNFKLWLDNDQDLHNYIIGEIKKIKKAPDNGQDVTYETSNFLRSYIADNVPNLNVSTRSQSVHGLMSDKNGFYSDILYAGLREINTREIAESYLEDLKEDEPEKMDGFDKIDHLEKRLLADQG